jgi:MFS family permease
VDQERAVTTPEAFTEPEREVRGGWITLLFLANLGLWLGFYAPIQVLLPRQAEALASVDKEMIFGVVTGFGAAVSVFANPVVGLLSDRTTSRFGRRHPWTVAGALLGAIGLGVLASAGNMVMMTVGWCLVQAGLSGMLASLTAAVPDRVPVVQRARVGGFVGISQMLGTVLGAVVVTVLVTDLAGGYLACAGLVLLGAAAFVVGTSDAALPKRNSAGDRDTRDDSVGDRGFRALLSALWVSPSRHPDFGWAWTCHFMINLGNALGTLYLLFFLGDAVHYPDPEGGLLILMGLYGVALAGGAVVAGRWSDASGRRRPYVVVSAIFMAVAALLLVASQTWTAALIAAPLLGIGFGVYWAVAIALLTQVLPSAADRAKDLGVINIANSLPQVIAPPLAALLLADVGGYPSLFAASALATLAAAVSVIRVRSVR